MDTLDGLGRRRGRPPADVAVSPKDERQLRHWLKSGKAEQRQVLRARIVLAAGRGRSTQEIAEELRVSVDTVSLWRNRYRRHGLDGLRDWPRSGRPRIFTPAQRITMVGIACEPAPAKDGVNGWTLDMLLEEVERRGVARVSRSQLQRILRSAELPPHKQQMWLHSIDPQFQEKVNDIVNLYVSPPEGSTVLCIDEKTGMQALERKHPTKPAKPGRKGRVEFEYIRHGTLSLFSAFNIKTGDVIGKCGPTRTADDLEAFLEHIAEKVTGEVHLIWDNLNIHGGGRWKSFTERWRRFNERHGNRFHFHYTPLHASWVNQVEIWFSILQKRCLKNASFKSVEDLQRAVEAFILHWNEKDKHPFKWSFLGYQRVEATDAVS